MAKVDTFYRAKRAANMGNVVAETVATRADTVATGQPVWTVIPASGKLTGQGFDVIARGSVINGAAGTVTLALRVGTTVAGILLASSGAISPGAGTFPFELKVTELVWDAASQTMRGRMEGFIGGIAIALTINSGAIAGFDPNGSVDAFVVFTAVFGTSNAANDVRLSELLTATS
jgi:hypothetical protein